MSAQGKATGVRPTRCPMRNGIGTQAHNDVNAGERSDVKDNVRRSRGTMAVVGTTDLHHIKAVKKLRLSKIRYEIISRHPPRTCRSPAAHAMPMEVGRYTCNVCRRRKPRRLKTQSAFPHKPPSWRARPGRIDKPLLHFLETQITVVGYLEVAAKLARS
jgi:hypothetical protein